MATPLEQKLAAALEVVIAGKQNYVPALGALDKAQEALREYQQANPAPPNSDYRETVLIPKQPKVPTAFLRDLGSEPLLPKIPRRRYTATLAVIKGFEESGGKLFSKTGAFTHIIAMWLKFNRESFIIVYDAGHDAFMVTRRSKLAAAIDEFDQTAHNNGWEQDQGSTKTANAAKNAYTLARRALLELLGIST